MFRRVDADSYLIGFVSGFGFMGQKKWTDTAYSKHYAYINHNYNKKLGVFARWFTVDKKDRSLVLYRSKVQGYVEIEKYYSIILAPSNENGKFILSLNVYEYVLE